MKNSDMYMSSMLSSDFAQLISLVISFAATRYPISTLADGDASHVEGLMIQCVKYNRVDDLLCHALCE